MLSLPQVIPSFFAAISILVLVWERFLDLSNKRLEYVYENVLKELYRKCYLQKISSEERILSNLKYSSDIQKLVDKLRRIGSIIRLYNWFAIIKLYPSKAIGSLRITCAFAKEYNLKIKELADFASKKMGKNARYDILAHLLGLGELNLDEKKPKQLKGTREFHEILQKEKEGLVNELRRLWRAMNVISVMEEVVSELKEFMEENSLSIPPIEISPMAAQV